MLMTLIFAESPDELQVALGRMKSYCDTWNLQVNTSKTKVVVFKEGKNQAKTSFSIIIQKFLKL